MKPPRFWYSKPNSSVWQKLLMPFARFYQKAVRKRVAVEPLYQSRLPVICIGNIVMGGSGKTPVVQAVVELLQTQRKKPCVLMRGYGGTIRDSRFIDETTNARLCGDEALLHARRGAVMISPDRVAGAKTIERENAYSHIIMDDGFQNPSLHKAASLVVLDGRNPFGNGSVFPAGPLRETLDDALPRTNALVILGDDVLQLKQQYADRLPVFQARLEPVNPNDFRGKHVLAFAGIGRPEKFFATMQDCGAHLADTIAFADHHMFTERELADILERAGQSGLVPVTTRKDWVRLPEAIKPHIQVLDVRLTWHNQSEVEDFLKNI